MEITVKLYASLSQYLPEDADKHAAKISISSSETALSVLSKFNVPEESAHLILLNGIYMNVEERQQCKLSEGDTLSVWPPVAGG